MRRHARWLPLVLVFSCNGSDGGSSAIGISMQVSAITLDRLGNELHLRIFPKGNFRCQPGTGQIFLGDVRTFDFPGRNVRPDERCGPRWESELRTQFGGVASPVDACISRVSPTTRHSVEVPAGNYIVLVEGSGEAPAAGGGTRIITLGSGCAEVNANPGQTLTVPIVMHEQAAVGRCGDRMVDADELCDDGNPSENCNNRCRFPERQVATTAMGTRRRPSVAWAPDQRLVVGFDAQDEVWVHLFDPLVRPITEPGALANDHPLAHTSVRRGEQQNVRLYATPTGYAAGWQSIARTDDYSIDGTVITSYDVPSPVNISVSQMPMPGRGHVNVTVAANSSRVVWVFEDQGTSTLRVASAPFASMNASLTDTPLLPPGTMGSMNASDPRMVALPNGEFVVTWAAGGIGTKDIYAIRLNDMGMPMGSPIMVNTQTGNDQDQPAIAAQGNDVVIAWRDASRAEDIDNSETTIRWRHFDAQLTPDGMDRIAPSTTAGAQQRPTVAISRNGVVLIAWENVPDGTIRGRLFRTDGAMVVSRIGGTTGDFMVNASSDEMPAHNGPRSNPSAAFGGSNRFVVAWEDQSTGNIHLRALTE